MSLDLIFQLTASLYLRLSSPDEDERTGFETQEADGRALAAKLGARVVAVHKDDGWSGVLRLRPGFRAWMRDGLDGINLLIAWKSDRISRGGIASVAPLIDLANGIDVETGLPHGNHRPRVLTCVDGVDSTQPNWETIFALHSETSKGERDATSKRMLTHRAANRRAGRAVGGRRPWVMDTVPNPDGPGSVRRPNPKRAEGVRWALEHLRKRGSKLGIVRGWVELGLEPKGSAKAKKAGKKTSWHVTPITRILSNPTLYGATIDHKELLRNEDGTIHIDKDQAVLSFTEFLELQVLLGKRSTARNNPARDDPTLLAGLLFCGSCERMMYPHRPEGGRIWTYRCRGGIDCPAPVSVAMSEVEPFLEEEFRNDLGDTPETPGGWEPDLVAVDPVEVATLQEAIDNVQAALRGDVSDDEALVLVRRRRDLRERLGALQDATQTADAASAAKLRQVDSQRTFGEAYDAAETIPEKTHLLGIAFNGRVTVHPGTPGHFDPSRLEWSA